MSESNVVSIAGKTGTVRNPRASAMYVSSDEALESDRTWFENNKECTYRLRESFPDEFPDNENSILKKNGHPFALVTQLAPGVRVQMFAPIPHGVNIENFDQIHIGVIAHLLGGDRYKRLVRSYEKHRD